MELKQVKSRLEQLGHVVTDDEDKDSLLLGLNLSTTDLIIYGVVAVAAIAIVVEAIVLLKGSKKKKNESE